MVLGNFQKPALVQNIERMVWSAIVTAVEQGDAKGCGAGGLRQRHGQGDNYDSDGSGDKTQDKSQPPLYAHHEVVSALRAIEQIDAFGTRGMLPAESSDSRDSCCRLGSVCQERRLSF